MHVVGHERAVGFGDVEHRMPAVFDLEHRLGDDRRPDVVRERASSASDGQHVDRASTSAVACSRRAAAATRSRSSTNSRIRAA